MSICVLFSEGQQTFGCVSRSEFVKVLLVPYVTERGLLRQEALFFKEFVIIDVIVTRPKKKIVEKSIFYDQKKLFS